MKYEGIPKLATYEPLAPLTAAPQATQPSRNTEANIQATIIDTTETPTTSNCFQNPPNMNLIRSEEVTVPSAV